MLRSEAVIDLNAIKANVETLRAGTSAEVMAVVKADGYGHGLLPSARAALAGGASWLGVAMLEEALALRAAGITVPILAWLWTPQEVDAIFAAINADIDISVSSQLALDDLLVSVRMLGRTARVHLKIDTGLSRNGITADEWPAVVAAAGRAAAAGQLDIVGIWSHFVYADSPGHPTTAAQIERFQRAVDIAARNGVRPPVKHLANSAATVTLPEAHFDLVRPGVAVYGLSPVPKLGAFGLRPAMTLFSHLANVKTVQSGTGVSYGHQYHTTRVSRLALVPLGYADGIARNASNIGPVQLNESRYTIAGRVCMDQFVLDVGQDEANIGDEVVLFGPGTNGEPTAQEWADALDTIHYEIVTRIGSRVPRRYVGLDGQPS